MKKFNQWTFTAIVSLSTLFCGGVQANTEPVNTNPTNTNPTNTNPTTTNPTDTNSNEIGQAKELPPQGILPANLQQPDLVNRPLNNRRDNNRPRPPRDNTQPRPPRDNTTRRGPIEIDLTTVEQDLQTLVTELDITSASREINQLDLPHISDPLAQLGKQLFFAKNLGGEQSVACASCHHPQLGGGDQLSLPVGVRAVNVNDVSNHQLLGPGRFNGNEAQNLPAVPRNSPTIFNLGLNDRTMFWDSRIERLRNGVILTPDSLRDEQGQRQHDTSVARGASLASIQAGFPITSPEEMRGDFEPDSDHVSLRDQLSLRFNNSLEGFDSSWPAAFELAFGDPQVNFERIAEALGAYERSMVFVNNSWSNYLDGDSFALSDQQKAGAMLFFKQRRDGGAGCANCHRGTTLSSRRTQLVAFPQMGPGKGNPGTTTTNHDYGRENITQDERDRFQFRAPSLLNIAVTAPYGHAGAFQKLNEVINHYADPRRSINALFDGDENSGELGEDSPFCQLPQVAELMQKNSQSCQSLYPDAYANSLMVVDHLDSARAGDIEAGFFLRRQRSLSSIQQQQLLSFLNALTDPCVVSRDCLTPWIIDDNDIASYPDPLPLVGVNHQALAL